MKRVSTEIFDDNLEEGKYFLVYEKALYTKNLYIIRIERTTFSSQYYTMTNLLHSYFRKVYEIYSGFGAVRHFSDSPSNQLRTYENLKAYFVQNWRSTGHYTEFYELSQDEVNQHVIMEQL